jgi:hypothetical protein
MPEMMCRCTMNAKIPTGMTAAISPHDVPMGVMSVGMATGSVCVLRPVSTSAKRNSFQELMTRIIDKGVDLAFQGGNPRRDERIVSEMKVAAVRYMESYLV